MQQFVLNLRRLWQRLSTGAKQTSHTAGEYVQRQRKVAALKLEVRRAQAQRDELYNVMGRKVYALHRKAKVANKDLLRRCQEIDELSAVTEAKQAQIEALRAAGEQEVEIEDETPLTEQEEEQEAEEEEAEEEEAEEEEAEQAEEAAQQPTAKGKPAKT